MFIEFPKVSGVIVEGMDQIRIPRMVTIRQNYDKSEIEDIPGHIVRIMEQELKDHSQFAGRRICVAVGSRGIPHLDVIVKTICSRLKEWGAKPFLIPAMGSHGGGTAQGQTEILAGYGITESAMGVPVTSSMEVVKYGELSNGTPLYCDKAAFESDGIVILNKVKPHTDFRGDHESGLAKMIAIGLAKHIGASAFHMQGFPEFSKRVPEAAELFLKKAPVAFGIGLVQNAYDQICAIEAAKPEDIMEMDKKLLKLAKDRLAVFKFNSLDVLVIDEIGKNISGYGQDPNVTGRANGSDESFKHILDLKKMVILGVTEESRHNGSGIAEADVTTLRCMRGIDWAQVWTNLITSTEIQGCKMPMYANSDREAVLLAIRCCNGIDFSRVRMARIKNTSRLHEIEVSEELFYSIEGREDIQLIRGPYEMEFDPDGNLI
ncbi:DUF2088 domain-containing protein [Clostridium sp. MCC353]|uniref:lactate racemase domain-containing protein n=1 Tax=Clostridium sp. MCC353 TaxID=2592646 RepID=UPI001C0316E1|nr:DUF2088 domain-containing protein [Clostridium sp. MCC353]